MALRYCFENPIKTLQALKAHDLAVVDTEGYESYVRQAVSRGVYAYGYLNVGALEKERPYYEKFKHLRLTRYDGWSGEYWIDPTDKAWQDHILDLTEKMEKRGNNYDTILYHRTSKICGRLLQ